MVEIKYGDQYEVSDLAGQTISEAREHFKSEFGIPDKAKARLNGGKVKASAELDTVLNDDDKITFAVSRGKGAYMVGALLLALACTGGVFAFGFINASTSLGAVAASNDFADVSVNDTTPVSWSPYGFFKGSIPNLGANGVPIFNVDTLSSTYPGDLAVSVSIANGDTLAKCYRLLALKIMMYDSSGGILDINADNLTGAGGDDDDYVLLTLSNGEVTMFPQGQAGGNLMTVRVKSGFYITHIYNAGNWSPDSKHQPLLFCEVAQR